MRHIVVVVVVSGIQPTPIAYTLLKFGSKPIPHTLYTGGGKVRLCEFRVEIPHGLFELVPVGLLI